MFIYMCNGIRYSICKLSVIITENILRYIKYLGAAVLWADTFTRISSHIQKTPLLWRLSNYLLTNNKLVIIDMTIPSLEVRTLWKEKGSLSETSLKYLMVCWSILQKKSVNSLLKMEVRRQISMFEVLCSDDTLLWIIQSMPFHNLNITCIIF